MEILVMGIKRGMEGQNGEGEHYFEDFEVGSTHFARPLLTCGI